MSFDKSITAKVNAQFSEKRVAAFAALDANRQEIYDKIPEISEIDRELSLTAVKLARDIASGGLTSDQLDKIKSENTQLQIKRAKLLVAHGYPKSYLSLRFNCAHCEDTGYIGSEMCHCYKMALKKCAYESSPLAKAFPNACFSSFELSYYSDTPDETGITPRERMAAVFDICRDFVSTFKLGQKSLLLWGPPGLGKTFLSGCIARDLVIDGYDVIYETTHNIFSVLERDRFSSSDETRAASARLFECDLLIIDDLGTEFITSFSVSALYNLVNTRLLNSRPMVINTNCELAELERIYTQRIISRLLGDFTLLKLYGGDIRLLKKKLSL